MSVDIKPEWLPDLQEYRAEPRLDSVARSFTSANRGMFVVHALREEIFPQHPRRVRLLDVGVGKQGYYFYCSYEPYMIAAALEGAGINYQMDIVDTDSAVIADLKKRRKIFFPAQYLGDLDHRDAWLSYLAATKQKARSRDKSDSVEPTSLTSPEDLRAQWDIMANLLVARVPNSFVSKLQDGGIKPIQGDIATARIGQRGRYNLIACVNVLYLLSESGQKLAFYNMANSLEKDGLLIMNDLRRGRMPSETGKVFTTSPILDFYGGWLTEEKMKDLGLVPYKQLESTGGNVTFSFKKI